MPCGRKRLPIWASSKRVRVTKREKARLRKHIKSQARKYKGGLPRRRT